MRKTYNLETMTHCKEKLKMTKINGGICLNKWIKRPHIFLNGRDHVFGGHEEYYNVLNI